MKKQQIEIAKLNCLTVIARELYHIEKKLNINKEELKRDGFATETLMDITMLFNNKVKD